MSARDVIVQALTARHEELSGEASPLDYDGARQILAALKDAGYAVVKVDDDLLEKATIAVPRCSGRAGSQGGQPMTGHEIRECALCGAPHCCSVDADRIHEVNRSVFGPNWPDMQPKVVSR